VLRLVIVKHTIKIAHAYLVLMGNKLLINIIAVKTFLIALNKELTASVMFANLAMNSTLINVEIF
jgi:hypothetical protein